jgi:hypothetical protein
MVRNESDSILAASLGATGMWMAALTVLTALFAVILMVAAMMTSWFLF